MEAAESIYRFDRAELNAASRELRLDGEPAQLGARAFDVLLALVTHRQRMLTKNELLDLVWPNLVVEENNLQVQVSALRKLLGAKAIVTVPGRGYRFAAALDGAPAADARGPAPVKAFAPTAAAAMHSEFGNLPAGLPPLLGRDQDLAQLRELVRDHRLVSLLGAGGIGKTSLARALARDQAHRFRDGAWMVELAHVSDPGAVPAAVARALRIHLPGHADPALELAQRLRGRELLLLDNCEHLIEPVAALVGHLGATVPELHILLTSQEPLRLAAEQSMRLGTLAVPGDADTADAATHGAVLLFAARVAALQPGFRLDGSNLQAVVDICRALDGMPLALELAAARVPLLGVPGVRQHLGQRLRILNNGARDAPSRHRTLRATLDWSHALLSPLEQKVFRRLGVFVGGFGLELAQQVAADDSLDAWTVLDLLGNLIDKSMVVLEAGATPRYRLLETARAYAFEALEAAGEWERLRAWHARCMRSAIDRPARAGRIGFESMDAWVMACIPEIDNLRSAIEWACGDAGHGGDPALALELVNTAAVLMYQAGRYADGVRWMRLAEPLVDDGTPPFVVAEFCTGLVMVGLHGGVSAPERMKLLERARRIFEQEVARKEATEVQEARGRLVIALCMSAYVGAVTADFESAEQHLARALELIEQPQMQGFRGLWLYNCGMVRRYQGRTEDALAAFSQSLPLNRKGGDARTLFYVLNNLAALHQEIGHIDEAVDQFRAMIEHLRRSPLTDAQMMAFALNWYAHALTVQGTLAEAQAQVMQSLPHCRRSLGLRHFAGMLALLAARQGRLRDAMRLVGCDDAARARRGEVRSQTDSRTLDAVLALVGASHPPVEVAAWRLEGAGLDEDAAIALASAGLNVVPA